MPSEKIKIKDKGHWNENAFQPTFVLFNEEKASGKKKHKRLTVSYRLGGGVGGAGEFCSRQDKI